MKNYKLILSINGNQNNIIKTGSIEEIDNYIYENNINNPMELFKCINKDGEYPDRNVLFKFKICTVARPTKTIDLLYKKDIHTMRNKYKNLRSLEDVMFEKLINDEDFENDFFIKYIYPATKEEDKITPDGKKIPNEKRICALSLIKYKNRYKEILSFEQTLGDDIHEKSEFELKKRLFCVNYQNCFISFCHSIMGIENKRNHKMKTKYDEKRDFYVFCKHCYKKKLVNSVENNNNNNFKQL